MPRFNFRLQQYLGIKEQFEDQKEIEYAQALRRLEQEKEIKRRLEEQRDAQIFHFRESLKILIKPSDLRRYNNTIEFLKRRINEQIQRIQAAQTYAEKKRLELVEAMKERKALESVKENALEEHIRAEFLTEQKEIDELISYKYSNEEVE